MVKLLPYTASVVAFIWGLVHLAFIKRISRLFGAVPPDKKMIFVMAWIVQAFVMIFIAELIFFVTLNHYRVAAAELTIYWLSAVFLLVLGLVSLIACGGTQIALLKLDPVIKVFAAGLIFASLLI